MRRYALGLDFGTESVRVVLVGVASGKVIATTIHSYADVTGREMAVCGAEQASALGAAMLGAVAAGKHGGGYDSLAEASARMAPPPARVYHPIPENVTIYDALYIEYRRLYDYFGRGENNILKTLRHLGKD